MNTAYYITLGCFVCATVLAVVLIFMVRKYYLQKLQEAKDSLSEEADIVQKSLLAQMEEAQEKAEAADTAKQTAELAKATAEANEAAANTRIEELKADIVSLKADKESLQQDKTDLTGKLEAANATIEEKAQAEKTAKLEREAYERKQIQLIEERIKTATSEAFRGSRLDLNAANKESIERLLSPFKQQMGDITELMNATKTSNDKNTASIEGAMKAMMDQTQQLGKDATNLADALKNKGKVHGDWGEQVLADILQGSGLIEGEQYVCQASFKGASGNELRPDVVVTNADGSRVIVDSKVSLTAYTDARGAENEEEYKAAVKANYESVWSHVKELAAKEYPKYVKDSINYVLMFVPNEGSYVMAMNYKPSLNQDAFRRGVIIVNPTNLMITLFLIRQAWQNTRQEENCKKILDAASDLIDKTTGVVDTIFTMGGQLDTVNKTFTTLTRQVSEGSGNLLRRAQGLKELGATSTKRPKNRKAAEAVDLNTPLSVAASAPELPADDEEPTFEVEDTAAVPVPETPQFFLGDSEVPLQF